MVEIGNQLKALRMQKGLTQEELAERTDLSKGYISQLENDLSSPSMETFFDILEVLGCAPKDFFEEETNQALAVYHPEDMTETYDPQHGVKVTWLNSNSNEHEMEPVILNFKKQGAYKLFQPSQSNTFGYVLKGKVEVRVGTQREIVGAGDSFYFEASAKHQLKNADQQESQVLIVVTNSYL